MNEWMNKWINVRNFVSAEEFQKKMCDDVIEDFLTDFSSLVFQTMLLRDIIVDPRSPKST